VIADVAFDAPLPPFSYRIPDGWQLAAGQRVVAPLRGTARVGVVVGLRDGDASALKPLDRLTDAAALFTPSDLDLVRWIAAESFTSFGSTCLALLPPAARGADRATSIADHGGGGGAKPALLTGTGRESRLLEVITASSFPALVLTADIDGAARWAQRLSRIGPVARLDSGVPDAERAAAWRQLTGGDARLAVGTRSAVMAPLEPGALVALVDEHDAGHKPPGAPRMHTRDVVLERARREGMRALLTSATPSVEMWWQADSGRARLEAAPPGPWPPVAIADTRGIARREALTPTLARAIRETLAAGRRVFLGVSRLTSALGCDECGSILRCERCAIALAYSPAGRTLACRLCAATMPLPNTCPACRGRRLTPFGWGAERVEHAVRRRFARANIVRYDPEAARGRRGDAQRAAALAADVVIGTRGALRIFGPGALGLAGFVSPDQILGLPDFRAAERTFGMLWAATERVRPDGTVVVQSQNPGHAALDAVVKQDPAVFYRPELKFRAELGYPPFRRLALITVTGNDRDARAALVGAALKQMPRLTVYPATPDRRQNVRRIVVKGERDLPALLQAAIGEAARAGGPRSRGIIDVEVDPVEWPF
jgi:primosomal protein N' (replication factor Y)